MMRIQEHRQEEQQLRILDEISALIMNLLRFSSSSVSFSDETSSLPSSSYSRRIRLMETPITPSGFASLLLGVSLSLMMSGLLTFFLGFMLMPWVIGLLIVLYAAGVVSTISMLCRYFLCLFVTPEKEIPEWKPW